MLFLLNLVGSTGDLYMAFYLCKLSNGSKIIDRNYGFDVIEDRLEKILVLRGDGYLYIVPSPFSWKVKY
jgi:hypothetical protein